MATRKRPDPPEKEETDPWAEQEPTNQRPIVRVEVPRPQRRHTLELIKGPGAPRVFELDQPSVTVGRAPECTLRISSDNISRHHVRFSRTEDEYVCEDLKSRNGVYLNGVKVHSATLRDEDQIQVGDAVFVYHGGF